jgi:hypothetical protein
MDWLKRVSESRRKKLEREIAKARQSDNLVDPLLFTLFSDKAEVIIKNGAWNIVSNQFDNDFKKIRQLRNHLAHANDYAASPETASDTCKTVRLIDYWIDNFSGWLLSSELSTEMQSRPAGKSA